MKNIENGVTSPPEKRWLRYPEVAKLAGVSERTVRRDVDEGKFPKPIKIRWCVCFDSQAVNTALETRKPN